MDGAGLNPFSHQAQLIVFGLSGVASEGFGAVRPVFAFVDAMAFG
jgi:hypothetical protein